MLKIYFSQNTTVNAIWEIYVQGVNKVLWNFKWSYRGHTDTLLAVPQQTPPLTETPSIKIHLYSIGFSEWDHLYII